MSSTDEFKKSRLGSVAMEGCGACHQTTGTIIMKRKGNPNGPEYTGPRVLVNPEARCEFCKFLGIWMASEGIEPGSKKCGAAKLVREDKSGVRELFAYLPFTEEDDRDKQLEDGTPFEIRHGTIIKVEGRDDKTMALTKIIEAGI